MQQTSNTFVKSSVQLQRRRPEVLALLVLTTFKRLVTGKSQDKIISS